MKLFEQQVQHAQHVIETHTSYQTTSQSVLIKKIRQDLTLHSLTTDGYIHIFDQSGNIVFSSTSRFLQTLPEVNLQYVLQHKKGLITIKNAEIDYLGYFSTYKPLEWIIISGHEKQYIFTTTKDYLFFIALTDMITFFVLMLVMFMVVNGITKRLQHTLISMQKIEEGHLGIQIQTEHKDEIGQIAHTFNNVSEKLKQNFDLLEQKVSERTQALLETNRRLEQKVLEHKRIETEVVQTNEKLVQEVVERERTEQALRYTYQKLLSFTQEIPMAYVEWNTDLLITSWNPAAEQIFIYSPQQAMHMQVSNLVAAKDRQQMLDTISQLQKNKTAIRQTLDSVTQDQREIICTWYNIPLFNEYGEVIQWLSLVQDVTEQKLNEEEIILQKEALQITLEHLENTQEELIQIEKMAALGQVIAGVAHEINTPLGAIRSAIGNISDFLRHDLRELPKFFSDLPEDRQVDFFLLLDSAAQHESILSTKEKRKIKKHLTQQLIEYQISNPDPIASKLVNIGIHKDIIPFLPLLHSEERESMLKQAYLLTSLQRSAYAISTASERAGRIVFALKSYARYDQSSEKIQANIIDGIETVLTLYHNQLKQGVEVVREYQEIPNIWCYPDELNQLWSNLVHNALQAMDYRGQLILATGVDGDYVYVKVTDTGKGIPDEIKYKIFQPFFTTKPAGEGSGMGLGIVKKIVEKHVGNIEVESRAGLTSFIVNLPIKAVEP
ncbi:ATP-binding protein [Candidatus Albibeggiatoa sp. nov. NOAA]|uniref:ATP-binding protein n=1 Tax=Candidatus Albibeggiatoa sp. nov. NOAA TaxID=3162724 RepID=UPI00330383A6|nr:ATP-binding protein [Thiotrichaceae bacterium]